jgi:hypothetical protein
MSRPLRVGDRVTATGTVSKFHGYNNGIVSIRFDGCSVPNGFYIQDADALTLIAPDEPPVGSIVVLEGVAYIREFSEGAGWTTPSTGICYRWDNYISDGDLIFTPGGTE